MIKLIRKPYRLRIRLTRLNKALRPRSFLTKLEEKRRKKKKKSYQEQYKRPSDSPAATTRANNQTPKGQKKK